MRPVYFSIAVRKSQEHFQPFSCVISTFLLYLAIHPHLVQRESNTHRISAALFGAFGLVVLALRQQGCVRPIQNRANISRRNVRSSFAGADFRSDEKLDAGNTRRIAKDNCDIWAEIRPSKPMRVRLPLD